MILEMAQQQLIMILLTTKVCTSSMHEADAMLHVHVCTLISNTTRELRPTVC